MCSRIRYPLIFKSVSRSYYSSKGGYKIDDASRLAYLQSVSDPTGEYHPELCDGTSNSLSDSLSDSLSVKTELSIKIKSIDNASDDDYLSELSIAHSNSEKRG